MKSQMITCRQTVEMKISSEIKKILKMEDILKTIKTLKLTNLTLKTTKTLIPINLTLKTVRMFRQNQMFK